MKTRAATTPRIYVVCLAAYNSGNLHGRWIDATDVAVMDEEIEEMLACSPVPGAEEWAIHDYDGFHGLIVGEFDDLKTISEWARCIVKHGPAFVAYINYVGSWYATVSGFEQSYVGEWASRKAFAEEHFHQVHEEIPEYLEGYIDWGAVARDLFINDFYSASSESGAYVFTRQ